MADRHWYRSPGAAHVPAPRLAAELADAPLATG